MRTFRRSFPAWLTVLGVAAMLGFGLEASAQLNLNRYLDKSWGDYTWGAWGASRETSRLGREELVARENYCPTGGCVLRLENVQVLPLEARQGDVLTLAATYTILTPDHVAIPVSISREISFQGKSLGRARSVDTRKLNGTFSHEIDFTLPATAAPGNYTLNTRVSTGYGMDQKNIDFRIY